jgi:hypothetical protein
MDTDGFHSPAPDRRRILGKADTADLIWIHHIRLANILQRWQWHRTILDLDDVQRRYEQARASVLRGSGRAGARSGAPRCGGGASGSLESISAAVPFHGPDALPGQPRWREWFGRYVWPRWGS